MLASSAAVFVAFVSVAGAVTTVDLSKDVVFSSGWSDEASSCMGLDYMTLTQGSSVTLSWYGTYIPQYQVPKPTGNSRKILYFCAGNEISSMGLQSNVSGIVTIEVDNLFPTDLDLWSPYDKCGTLFSFTTGAPPADHNMTLTFKGPSPSAPKNQLDAEFHLAAISYVQPQDVCAQSLTLHRAVTKVLDRSPVGYRRRSAG